MPVLHGLLLRRTEPDRVGYLVGGRLVPSLARIVGTRVVDDSFHSLFDLEEGLGLGRGLDLPEWRGELGSMVLMGCVISGFSMVLSLGRVVIRE